VERAPWLDLRAVEPDRWMRAVLKGTDVEVELVVLHHDPLTGAATSVVRFPPGLRRDELGCYPAAEELVVLDGALDFAGRTFVAGDYVYVPPRVQRTPMASPDGLLVLAWFSGAPAWLTDPDEAAGGDVGHASLKPGVLRPPSDDVPGTTQVETALQPTDVDREVLDIPTGRWCFLPAGTATPTATGPFVTRTWPAAVSA
jgi:hypothetical protein